MMVDCLFNFSEMFVTCVQTQYSLMKAHACQIFKLKNAYLAKTGRKRMDCLFKFSEMLVTGVQKLYSMMEAHACQIFKIKECVSGKDREKERDM